MAPDDAGLTVPKLYEENTRLRWALREARDELAKHGWGDMHYGSTGQEKSVTDTLAKIDLVLGGDSNHQRPAG